VIIDSFDLLLCFAAGIIGVVEYKLYNMDTEFHLSCNFEPPGFISDYCVVASRAYALRTALNLTERLPSHLIDIRSRPVKDPVHAGCWCADFSYIFGDRGLENTYVGN
jgi:hypothetical protein